MFGKIIDGKLVIAGQKIEITNGWITNPTEEQLKENGYKEVVYNEKPTYDIENEKLQEKFTDKKKITVNYDIVELTDEEHNEVIQAEILEEENKITSRNIRTAIKGDEFALNKIDEVESNIATLRKKLK